MLHIIGERLVSKLKLCFRCLKTSDAQTFNPQKTKSSNAKLVLHLKFLPIYLPSDSNIFVLRITKMDGQVFG